MQIRRHGSLLDDCHTQYWWKCSLKGVPSEHQDMGDESISHWVGILFNHIKWTGKKYNFTTSLTSSHFPAMTFALKVEALGCSSGHPDSSTRVERVLL